MRRVKIIAYVIFGIALVCYILFTIFYNVTKLEVNSAVVTSPILTIQAPTQGIVSEVHVVDGQDVVVNTPLLEMKNPSLEKEVIEAQYSFAKAKIELKQLEADQDQQQAEMEQAKAFLGIEAKQWEQMETMLTTKEASFSKKVGRARDLLKKGIGTRREVDALEDEYTDIRQDLIEARGRNSLAKVRLEWADKGFVQRQNTVIGNAADFDAQRSAVMQKIEAEQDQYNSMMGLKSALAVVAPEKAKVLKVLATKHGSVKNGQPIVLLERLGDKFVNVFLTREQVASISAESEVQVYIPKLDESYTARIHNVDFTSQSLDALKSTFFWRYSDGMTVTVTLVFTGESPKFVETGEPAVVRFNRVLGFFGKKPSTTDPVSIPSGSPAQVGSM